MLVVVSCHPSGTDYPLHQGIYEGLYSKSWISTGSGTHKVDSEFGDGYQEQKLTAGFKTQLEKLQLERDEFQRMLIATQV